MKKTLVFIFVFFGLGLGGLNTLVDAQGADEARSDYLFVLDQYRASHDEYIKARQNYFEYRNLASKNKALEVEKKVLLARNEAIKTYFFLLKKTLSSSRRPGQMTKDPIENLINIQLEFLAGNKKRLLAAGSVKDLDSLALELESRRQYLTNLARLIKNHIRLGRLGFHFFEIRKASYKLLFMAVDRLGGGNVDFIRYSNDINTQLVTTLKSWERSSSAMGRLMVDDKWLKADWQPLETEISDLESQLTTFINFNQDMIDILEK